MKDGYYLAVYICIDKIGHIKGFETRHDFSISLWKKKENNVTLVHYWELERESGIKQHGRSFFSVEQAKEYINSLLKNYDLSIDDMTEVWGIPEISINESSQLKKMYSEIYFHSICHLYSSLLLSMNTFRNENILAFALDGSPDYLEYDKKSHYYFAAAYSEKGNIKEVYPIASPAELWTAAKLYFKKREGTLMALAYASNSEAYIEFEPKGIMEFKDTGKVYKNITQVFSQIMNFTEEDEGINYNYMDSRFSDEENKISMAMKIVQKASFSIMEAQIEDAIMKYSIIPSKTVLSLSGGFALNCPTNSYIVKKYGFKDFIAPPCINDGGISLGIGLLNFYSKLKGTFRFEFKNAFYGDCDNEIEKNIYNYSYFIKSVNKFDFEQIAKDIKDEPVVWFYGRAEIGPRALGHRSLLANPCDIRAKERLNQIKQREWWRPVAPIVLEECMEEWFEDAYASPFMLHNFLVLPSKKKYVPAILHLDDTARVQTINSEDDSVMYNIIKKFYELTQIPMICNTSLNDRGEPIINTISEAFNFALRKKLHIMYINGIRIELINHDQYVISKPEPRKYNIDFLSEKEKELWLAEENPYDLDDNILHYYVTTNKKFEYNLSLKSKKDVAVLIKLYKYHQQRV